MEDEKVIFFQRVMRDLLFPKVEYLNSTKQEVWKPNRNNLVQNNHYLKHYPCLLMLMRTTKSLGKERNGFKYIRLPWCLKFLCVCFFFLQPAPSLRMVPADYMPPDSSLASFPSSEIFRFSNFPNASLYFIWKYFHASDFKLKILVVFYPFCQL